MSLLLTTVFENGFCEIYLPNVNNRTVPTDIKPYISGSKEDITLPLEVWDDKWELSGGKQFTITEREWSVDKVELRPGLLLNCELKADGKVFSLTVDEVGDGNTKFSKYVHNPDALPCVTIGSEDGNVVQYKDKFVSPRHAEITFRNGQGFIRDRDSVNGTFVNGRLLSGERQLKYGDVIYIIGLKIVYLNNVFAINNPKNACTVTRLKQITIKASGEEEQGDEYVVAEEYFLRTPRKLEQLDTETVTVEKCPAKQQQKKQPILFTIGPAFTMVIPMAVGAMMTGEGGFGMAGLVMSVGAALIGALWAIINIIYQNKDERESEAKRIALYSSYLTRINSQIQAKMQHNRAVLAGKYPSASDVAGFALRGDHRLWEKSAAHDDFLELRIGVGDIPSPNEIVSPKEQAMSEYDPLNDSMQKMCASLSMLTQVPVAVSLHKNQLVGVISRDRARLLNLGNIISAQIAGAHPYTDVRMCYVYPSRETDNWDYAKWLPHVWSPDGKLRMLSSDKTTLGDVMYFLSGVIRDRLERDKDGHGDTRLKILPHYVVVVSDWSLIEEAPVAKYLLNPTPAMGITVVILEDSVDKLPSGCTAIIEDGDELSGFYSTTGAFPACRVTVDKLSTSTLDAAARSLSNFHVREMNVSSAVPDMLTFLDMYKTSRIDTLDILHRWLENRTYESMRSLIGYKAGSQPLYLDIHEKYHGPHGLVAGTTGSGKSETLQSYILSLVVNYHPHEVAFILIDYKGGGMAQSFIGLPHLSGVITNLGGNATNRALLSINSEIKRRQRVFNEYKVKHIDAYIELYRSGVAAEPLPHLLIIADEFAELKKEQPEFVRALVSAARVGRSLGVNLILATQKPGGVVDDEIWGNTRFRLCLRVADKQDSNEMLKRPDAAFITGTGRGFFQVGNDEIFEEFQSGWSGAPYEPDVPFTDDKNVKVEMINLIGKPGVPKKKGKKSSGNITKITQLDAVVRYAAKIAEQASIPPIKQIWLPPLPQKLYLEDAGEVTKPAGFSLLLPIGLVDNPESQSQYPAVVDFMADGHLLICGSAGSGKTTLLQTMLYSAVTRYTPDEVNIYIADFSSRTMAVFGGLPHVGGVVFEGDNDNIQSIFELLHKTLAKRKEEFSKQGIGSFKEYVTQHSDAPAILFVIDNYVAFAESYEIYEDFLVQLSRESASYGIYLVLTCTNSGDLRSRIRQNFTAGIALQMTDKYEYEAVINDRTEIIPEGRTAGRGLIKAPLPVEFQTALCVREREGMSQAQTLRHVFEGMQGGGGVRKIGAATETLTYSTFVNRDDVKALPENMLPIGITDEGGLVTANLDDEYCYTVGGSGKSGKTNFLRYLARYGKSHNMRVFMYDGPARELEELAPKLDGYCADEDSLFKMMESTIVPEFTARNRIVGDARDAGASVREAMKGKGRMLFLVNDMAAFIKSVYSERMNMSGFFEVALQKGREHKICFFAAVTPDDHSDMIGYAAMRTFADYGRGLHLGGMFDQQTILEFELSAANMVRKLQSGACYAMTANGAVERVVTPHMEG